MCNPAQNPLEKCDKSHVLLQYSFHLIPIVVQSGETSIPLLLLPFGTSHRNIDKLNTFPFLRV